MYRVTRSVSPLARERDANPIAKVSRRDIYSEMVAIGNPSGPLALRGFGGGAGGGTLLDLQLTIQAWIPFGRFVLPFGNKFRPSVLRGSTRADY